MVAAVGESAAGSATAGGVHGFAPVLTSFVGRAAAVGEVAALLGEGRLVTVTGPGGVGKTRLAGEVARAVAGRFADGGWLAELAAVADPAQVAAVVAVALGVREQPGALVAEALAQVLVLDNCEHVIGAAAELCANLVAAADDVRILATSRERLRVAGEACYRLAPLALPGPEDAADGGGGEAVALFVDRARRADAHFALAEGDGPVVGRLVARLDGMPLAIELAAARVEALGVAGLAGRIEDRFSLLAGGDRLAADRQRSLAATVEWSYQLLDDRERRVFRKLSVFPGPFTLEGAEAVAGEGAAAAVVRLVDCSLLSPPRPGPDGWARYLMLETLRAYGAGLLVEAREQEQAAAALAVYALQVAEDAAPGLESVSGEGAAVRRLDAEDVTMRQALAWTAAHDVAMALRLAGALGWWWLLRGRLAGNYPLLREAADRAEVGSDGWCAAQFWLGYTAFFSADFAGGLDHFTALRDAVGGRGPSRALADALAGRATMLWNQGRLGEAADDARRAVALAQEIGDPAREVMALKELSFASLSRGELDSAVQLARQAAQITDGIPGVMARWCGYVLTIVLAEAGDLAAAERAGAAALAESRAAGDLWNQHGLLTRMAMVDLQAGRVGDAAAHLQEAFQVGMRTGGWVVLASGLEYCGQLCAATGRPAEAITVWAATDALWPGEGLNISPAEARQREQNLRKARQALGAARIRAAEERGAAMSRDTAAEFVLLLTAAGPQRSARSPSLVKLSARERELVTLVAQGRTDAQIAAQLYISVRTVSSHLDRIRDKTGCRRRADLTRLALTTGLI
jgi:predicted ATPase/DNA-binding CsgD family transcriptional regulator